MTYGMVREVLQALEDLLERHQRWFETGFTLMDENGVSLGHGEVDSKPRPVSVE